MLSHVAARVFNTPLLIHRPKLDVILAVLGPRIGLPEAQLAAAHASARSEPTPTRRGIAVIPIHGTLVRRAGGLDALSGLTSYEAIDATLTAALNDATVEAIVLDVDSPGGEAAGVFDLADRIRAARDTKSIVAVANDAAFSAAYALASAASHVFVTRTGGVGSIGVIALHVDQSRKDAAEGLRYTPIFAGRHKNDGSPHEALGDDALATIQAEVDRLHGLLVATVAGQRGLDAKAVRGTEARLFFGDDAVAAGLADRVGTLADALDFIATDLRPRAALRSPTTRTTTTAMDTPNPAPSTTAAVPTPTAAAPTPDAAHQARADAQAIAEYCLLAGRPQLTADFIAKGLSPATVRQTLLAQLADGAEITSRVAPDAVSSATSLDNNPVVRAAKARATAAQER
jgi:signal peptide peptidase SppA